MPSRPAFSWWRSSTRSRRPGSPVSHIAFSSVTTSMPPGRPPAATERAGRVPPLPGRGRSGVRPLGLGSACRDGRRQGMDRREALPQRQGELHGADVRGRDHGARVDAADHARSPRPALGRLATLGGGTPAAWWLSILMVGPLFGSFITEPAAMTICALLLGAPVLRPASPAPRLKYATLGLLFVNVSIGGTLTHFAAPPVLMVARPWGWDTRVHVQPLRLAGRRRDRGRERSSTTWCSGASFAALGHRELPGRHAPADDGRRTASRCCRAGLGHGRARALHGLDRDERALSGALRRRLPVLPRLRHGDRRVSEPDRAARRRCSSASFSAGLVIHGGLQGWWIAPVLARPVGSAALLRRRRC